jgi:glycosyltransferase involved in cell wall biosynthesis
MEELGMKIALIAPPWLPVPPPAYGGTEAVIDTLAVGLQQAGHDVTLYAHPGSTTPVRRCSIVTSLDEQPVIGDGSWELSHVIGAYDALDNDTVVHDHTLAGPLLARRSPNLAVAVTNHGPYVTHTERVLRAYPSNVRLISVSRSQAGSTDLPSTVIHHGIDVAGMPFGDGDGGYALFLGRMTETKGVHRAIQVARAAGTRLVIAAKMREPNEIAYFRAFVEPHLDDDVVYAGEVDVSSKRDLLAGAVALINPIRWLEPFGMVMIEALACGTPVLACPHGAAPEIVEHGVHGFLDDDLHILAGHLHGIAQLDRTACRDHVAEHFSVGRMVAGHVALYEAMRDDHRLALDHSEASANGNRRLRPSLV